MRGFRARHRCQGQTVSCLSYRSPGAKWALADVKRYEGEEEEPFVGPLQGELVLPRDVLPVQRAAAYLVTIAIQLKALEIGRAHV